MPEPIPVTPIAYRHPLHLSPRQKRPVENKTKVGATLHMKLVPIHAFKLISNLVVSLDITFLGLIQFVTNRQANLWLFLIGQYLSQQKYIHSDSIGSCFKLSQVRIHAV